MCFGLCDKLKYKKYLLFGVQMVQVCGRGCHIVATPVLCAQLCIILLLQLCFVIIFIMFQVVFFRFSCLDVTHEIKQELKLRGIQKSCKVYRQTTRGIDYLYRWPKNFRSNRLFLEFDLLQALPAMYTVYLQ